MTAAAPTGPTGRATRRWRVAAATLAVVALLPLTSTGEPTTGTIDATASDTESAAPNRPAGDDPTTDPAPSAPSTEAHEPGAGPHSSADTSGTDGGELTTLSPTGDDTEQGAGDTGASGTAGSDPMQSRPPVPVGTGDDLDFGDQLDPPPLEPPCSTPPCEPFTLMTGAEGGYLPLDPIEVLDTRDDTPLVAGPARTVPVGAALGDTDLATVGAVVLAVTARDATGPTEVSLWATGGSQPPAPTLVVPSGQARSTVAVTPLGADGTVSVSTTAAAVEVHAQVLGWFPDDTSFRSISPAQALGGTAVGPDPVGLTVTGVGGVPAAGVAAVALHVSGTTDAFDAAVTVWPAGTPRPDTADLSVRTRDTASNLVIAEVGAGGAVSLATDGAPVDLSAQVVGWFPTGSSYRPVAPQRLFDTGADAAPTGVIDVVVTDADGMPVSEAIDPADDQGRPNVVALNITTTGAERSSEITVWPSGGTRPDEPTLSVERRRTTTNLVLAEVGDGGQVSIYTHRARAQVTVDVVGWFDRPAAFVALQVPDSTRMDLDEYVLSVDGDSESGALVELAAGAPLPEPGDRLVLSVIDPHAPLGLMGEVTEVSPIVGGTPRWAVVVEPTTLQDAFPEGDIGFDLSQVDAETIDFTLNGEAVGRDAEAHQAPRQGLIGIDFQVGPDQTIGDCDLSSLQVNLGAFLDFEFGIKFRWFKAPNVTALTTLGAYAGIVLDQIALECGFDTNLVSKKIVIKGIVINVDLDAAIDFYAGLTGIEFDAGAEASVTVGVRNNRLVAEADTDAWATSLEDIIDVRSLSAYLMVDLWLEMSVKLYGSIGPVISVGPFAETGLTVNQDKPWWWVDLGLAAKVRLDLDLWFKSWSYPLLDAEVNVAGLMGLDPCSKFGPGVGFCATPAPTQRLNGDVRQFQPRLRVLSSNEPLPGMLAASKQAPTTARHDTDYTGQLVASGFASADSTWHLAGGALPTGVGYDSTTGQLSGRIDTSPVSTQDFSATFELWWGPEPDGGYDDPRVGPDNDGIPGFPFCDEPYVGRTTCNRWYGPGATTPGDSPPTVTVDVRVYPQARITTDSLDEAVEGFAYGPVQLQAVGWPTYVWSVRDGELPPGLTLSTDGVISGTPTAVGTYPFAVEVNDAGAEFDGKDFVLEVEPLRTERVSVDAAGTEANGRSIDIDLSADGRDAAFSSDATNLVPGAGNGDTSHIFVKDLHTGAVEHISASLATGDHREPAISGDGRYVSYVRGEVWHLPPWDLVVHDRQTGTEVVATDAPCVPAATCAASDWVNRDTVGIGGVDMAQGGIVVYQVGDDIFRYEVGGENRMVNITPLRWDGQGTPPARVPGFARAPTVSADGSVLAYEASDPITQVALVEMDATGGGSRELLDPGLGTFTEVPVVSSDGSTVVFVITDEVGEIIAYDRVNQTYERVTDYQASGGVAGHAGSIAVSGDGRFVAYVAWEYYTTVRLVDRQTGRTRSVVVPTNGITPEAVDSLSPTMSADGSVVGFVSDLSNLVADDTNSVSDAFVYRPSPAWLNPPSSSAAQGLLARLEAARLTTPAGGHH